MITPNTVPVSDENAAVHAIVLAFSADPAARWLYTNPHQYLTNFPRFVRAFAGAAFEQGSADCVEDYSGVALWLPPGIHSEEKALIELLQQTVPNRTRQACLACSNRWMLIIRPSRTGICR